MNTTLTTLKNASRHQLSAKVAGEVELGWQAMGVMSFATAEDDGLELGWNAMPAYGQVSTGRGNAAEVADFVAASHPVSRQDSGLTSFWSAVSL